MSRTRQLKSALVKISSVKTEQRQNILATWTTSLFVYSQIGSLKSAFTAHPNLDTRLRHIGWKTNSRGDAVKTVAVAVLLGSTLFLAGGYISTAYEARRPDPLQDRRILRAEADEIPGERSSGNGCCHRIAPMSLQRWEQFPSAGSDSLLPPSTRSIDPAAQHLLTEDAVRLAGVASYAGRLPLPGPVAS